ncbi:MAG: NAD(P)/FAD-dependent oxidoreductase [Candidatus Krumholzibacteria bacterium]|nr:NAD(P)/FAD-dependent oxidoreductase [Candidatus Krumholzibacteria bacterium]MDH4335866.1 NAD(P)/FAD-dependent oxidoreductase [Candidatus Krumholzibacteria bacterium]MDH5270358.1 NAD(P)/FAD-dependent oxidoreductase [Candidatus Krumholzibacteria bacterium]
MARYDVIVIGAGHNGLTTACLLARAGRRVLVLERRDITGGMCASEEFHPGYRTPGLLHDTLQVRSGVVEALRLDQHGLDLVPPPAMLLAGPDGRGISIQASADATAVDIAKASAHDAERWREFSAFVVRARRVIEPLLNDAPPDIGAIGSLQSGSLGTLLKSAMSFQRLGKREMAELLRVPPMCVADWMNEWFEGDLLKAGMAHGAVLGMWAGPWSPGTAANLLLEACTAGQAVKGGAGALAFSLERAARHHGVEIRTGTAVSSLAVSGTTATGVVLASGETVEAGAVAASCDPRTLFLSLVAAGTLPLRFERRVGVVRARGTTAKVHLALDRRLEFAARPGERVSRARTATTLDDLERAFDAVKYGRASENPVLDISVPSVSNPEMAPEGRDSVSLLVHFAPHALAGGWDDGARERLGDAAVAALERVAPGVGGTVVAREVLTPVDIASRYGADGGHIHHTEHALDQLAIRPTMETMRYATPLANLYLCGSGSHPGGGVTCAPGALGAAAILSRR